MSEGVSSVVRANGGVVEPVQMGGPLGSCQTAGRLFVMDLDTDFFKTAAKPRSFRVLGGLVEMLVGGALGLHELHLAVGVFALRCLPFRHLCSGGAIA